MPIASKDIVPFSQVRARLTELVEEAAKGWADVTAGRHASVAELKAKYGRSDATPDHHST